jgi:tetratricopeptide (TPR) repeat protein
LLGASGTSFSQATKAQLEVSETFFTITTALNNCGYDAGLEESLPLRKVVRGEVQSVVQKSPPASQALSAICKFWNEHQPQGTSNDVTQYTSLALELGAPPQFDTVLPEADLPPDAAHVLGVLPLLRKFYQAAGMHALWERHRNQYESLRLQFRDPVSEVITQTDLYLKLPFNNYPGQRMVVYLEPMLSPNHVDSRNYGTNYFLITSPGQDGQLKLAQVRHTYLHFALDPMALQHGGGLKQLETILLDIQGAPLSSSFKYDISLMVNECLIRAIETRASIPKSNDSARVASVQKSVQEGFVLTRYFYEALATFEKESTGMRDAYGNLLHAIDLERERKRAREVVFAAEASPEVISSSKPVSAVNLLDTAEQKLAMGDKEAAQKLAMQVIERNQGGEEAGRASFILARIALLSSNIEQAQSGFEQAAKSVHDARLQAWSHIYLGRIFDLQEKREAAVAEYQAALSAGDPSPDTKGAAERGLSAPFQPRAPR